MRMGFLLSGPPIVLGDPPNMEEGRERRVRIAGAAREIGVNQA
jgi:hypothetical protein